MGRCYSRWVIILPSFVVKGIAVVEIKCFQIVTSSYKKTGLCGHFTLWVKVSQGKSPSCHVWWQ